MDIGVYKKIDKAILDLSLKLEITRYIEAKNLHKEKRNFLKGKIKNPQFIYRNLRYNPQKAELILNELNPPSDTIGKIFKNKIKELELKNRFLKNLGNKKILIGLSEELYGRPSKLLIKKAKDLLSNLRDREYITESGLEKISSWELACDIKNYLKKLGIKNWSVVRVNKHSASVLAVKRIIKLNKYKKYSKLAVKRLKIHEINVHVLRGENGYIQPFKIFVSGLPNYLSTEEGIATYMEEKNKVETIQSKRRFALRAIAVDLVYQGADFRECFEKINSYCYDDSRCWDITYRVFRGGGFLKDHVYLQGYYQIKDYLGNKGKLKDLYIGKIGLDDVSICKKLVADGLLNPPKYLPK